MPYLFIQDTPEDVHKHVQSHEEENEDKMHRGNTMALNKSNNQFV